MSLLSKSILLLFLASMLTSCYRMPEEDEYSLIPSTNNPTYTREKAGAVPGVGY
jgi:hypothetical protein